MSTISRRDLIRTGGIAAGGLLLSGPVEAAARSKVVVITTKAAISREQPAPLALIERMVEKGITRLAGKSDPVQAWLTFVRTSDVVALPTAGGQLESVPEVNVAVYRALAKAGVNAMMVGTHRMSDAWHSAVLTQIGDAKPEIVNNGKLYGIQLRPMDALVAIPTVKHHDISGVSGLLKNYATFSKKGPWNYHGEYPSGPGHSDSILGGGMGACGWVPANDFKDVRKLHVIDMIRVGTTSRSWTAFPDGWVYTKSLVFSTDPVAADRVAMDIYLKVGKASGTLDPLHHVERAESEYKAGIADLARIDVVRVTV